MPERFDQRIQLSLTPKQMRKLKARAKTHGLGIATLARMLIVDALDRDEKDYVASMTKFAGSR